MEYSYSLFTIRRLRGRPSKKNDGSESWPRYLPVCSKFATILSQQYFFFLSLASQRLASVTLDNEMQTLQVFSSFFLKQEFRSRFRNDAERITNLQRVKQQPSRDPRFWFVSINRTFLLLRVTHCLCAPGYIDVFSLGSISNLPRDIYAFPERIVWASGKHMPDLPKAGDTKRNLLSRSRYYFVRR